MEFLSEYGLFLAKTITFVLAFVAIVVVILSAGAKGQGGQRGAIEIKSLNDHYDSMLNTIKHTVFDNQTLKAEHKREKQRKKEEQKKRKQEAKARKNTDSDSDTPAVPDSDKRRVFVASFDGDIKASETEELREVITGILSVARAEDEVVVKLESPGGLVHGYGLAASQLKRITDKGIPLTVCVDKVAASGGYMMACVANKILAAPFAIVGSIGVVAQLPNFHRLLKKHDVDFEVLSAGEYKRTLTMFGENTEKGRQKFVEDLEETHELFKDFIRQNREIVDIDQVSTGEFWFGIQAMEKKLVDDLQTSDSYLFDQRENADLYEVSYTQKKSVLEKLGVNVEAGVERAFGRIWQKLTALNYT